MRNNIKRFYIVIICIMLLIPNVYKFVITNLKLLIDSDNALDYYEKPNIPKVDLTFKNWMDLAWQDNFDLDYKENIGLHNLLIRVFNQYTFWFYNDTQNESMRFNVNQDIFQNFYDEAEIGKDFIGFVTIKENVKKLNVIQENLSKENIKFLYLILPSKSKLNVNQLSFRNTFEQKSTTNYEVIIDELKKQNINFINFAEYITPERFNKHPLYPQYEVHMSQYTTGIIVDSLNKYMNSQLGLKTPKIKSLDYYYEKENPSIDEYVLRLLNLLIKPNQRKTPFVSIQYDTSKSIKPKVFSIADSYYNNISFSGYFKTVFDSNSLNANQYNYVSSEFNQTTNFIGNTYDLKKEYKKFDLILIINTVPNTSRIGWGFVDEFYNHFKQSETPQSIP